MSHTIYGASCYAKRDLTGAQDHLLEGRSLCERVGMYTYVAMACFVLAETYFEMKELQKSKECYDQGNRFWGRLQILPSWVRLGQLGMARCGAVLGERDMDLQSLGAIPGKNRIKIAEGSISAYLGEIFLNLGGSHLTEAEHWICKAIEANEKIGARFHLGLNYALYAEFFKRQGDRTKAEENLGKAIEILKKCGANGWVEKYERESAALQ
jgi:tetratricopeptide (TPR) repeat protein